MQTSGSCGRPAFKCIIFNFIDVKFKMHVPYVYVLIIFLNVTLAKHVFSFQLILANKTGLFCKVVNSRYS